LFCDSEISYLVNKIQDPQDTTTQQTQTIVVPTVIDTPKTINEKTNEKLYDEQFEQNLSFSFSPPTQITTPNEHTMLSTSSSSSSTAVMNLLLNRLKLLVQVLVVYLTMFIQHICVRLMIQLKNLNKILIKMV
jgi:hypothetical protein